MHQPRSVLALAALCVAASVASGCGAGDSTSLTGDTPTAKKVAADTLAGLKNEGATTVKSVDCLTGSLGEHGDPSTAFLGYRCSVKTSKGELVCDSVSASCDTVAHYQASVEHTSALVSNALNAVNASGVGRRFFKSFAPYGPVVCLVGRPMDAGHVSDTVVTDFTVVDSSTGDSFNYRVVVRPDGQVSGHAVQGAFAIGTSRYSACSFDDNGDLSANGGSWAVSSAMSDQVESSTADSTTSDATTASSGAAVATAEEAAVDAVVRSHFGGMPRSCMTVTVRLSQDGEWAEATPRGHYDEQGQPVGQCSSVGDGFYILQKTNGWSIVFNGSVGPPCSLGVPRDLRECEDG